MYLDGWTVLKVTKSVCVFVCACVRVWYHQRIPFTLNVNMPSACFVDAHISYLQMSVQEISRPRAITDECNSIYNSLLSWGSPDWLLSSSIILSWSYARPYLCTFPFAGVDQRCFSALVMTRVFCEAAMNFPLRQRFVTVLCVCNVGCKCCTVMH